MIPRICHSRPRTGIVKVHSCDIRIMLRFPPGMKEIVVKKMEAMSKASKLQRKEEEANTDRAMDFFYSQSLEEY